MKERTREEPSIIAAAERQMQSWVLHQEIADRAVHAHGPHGATAVAKSFVTISREAGAGGGQIAQLVGRRLGWEVLDKNLLDRVADRFHHSRLMLELVDETESNWVYDVLGTWMDRKLVPHTMYVKHLCRVLLAAARRGPCVLVGRGAQFLLPRDRALAVRIIAPEKYRIARIVEERGLDAAAARRWMEEIDGGRREFVERFFHRDINDPHLYDLVLNAGQIGPERVADLIVAAAKS